MAPRLVRRRLCILLVGLLFASAATFSNTPDVKRWVGLFESRYRAPRSLRATFLERYTEGGRLVRVETGTAYFLRPGKMRWEYESPEKNLFLVDGKMAWFYVPADHTVTRVPAKQSSDWRTPLALLAGEMKVSRVCSRVETAKEEKPESPDHAILYCALRGGQSPESGSVKGKTSSQTSAEAETVFFEVAKDTGELVRVIVRDPGGIGLEFHFANWQLDPPVPASLFQFQPPLGVAIVNGELPAPNNLVK
jgi:outer membrane lipoprotein carrier protein